MKRELWIKVTVQEPNTGEHVEICSRKGSCPNCGQSRCTRRNALCIAIQKAIKEGKLETFTM